MIMGGFGWIFFLFQLNVPKTLISKLLCGFELNSEVYIKYRHAKNCKNIHNFLFLLSMLAVLPDWAENIVSTKIMDRFGLHSKKRWVDLCKFL